ncbi:glycosyltransferase family 4 protein [Mucilaginibacter sp. RS28]|uniref:Glycosyltransferase family 4 protein n=1 Tax=Mucilaginibacter straminoryzae TaxID=2932774 RepID=A0A9X1X217_9SPHI|nr:glycosyltransferase family 1 protein [Mucilaginibacter straminoryzae]MCJ8209797.1 glycosyltransferase family 4 protein [Mucilaginibacter straminoryzae]
MANPLTIGVDIRELRVAKTGVKTYLEEICREFKLKSDQQVKFIFLDSWLPAGQHRHKAGKLIEHFNYHFWKQVTLPLKAFFNHCDVVLCVDNFAPLLKLGYKTLPVFHDAFFFETPQDYGKIWLWLYKQTAIPAAKSSPFVITPSEHARKKINYYTGIPLDKLVVVHEAPKSFTGKLSLPESVLERFNLQPALYILHVGAYYTRKNLVTLVNAFASTKSALPEGMKLVLAGGTPAADKGGNYTHIQEAIKSSGLENDVILTGYLPDDEIQQLYQNALLYVFPSLNEGFGLPVLEAFKNSLPVIVADNSSLPEIGGDAVLCFSPDDELALAEKIKLVVEDNALRQEMIEKGQLHLEDFSWSKTADQIIDVCRKAAGR